MLCIAYFILSWFVHKIDYLLLIDFPVVLQCSLSAFICNALQISFSLRCMVPINQLDNVHVSAGVPGKDLFLEGLQKITVFVPFGSKT